MLAPFFLLAASAWSMDPNQMAAQAAAAAAQQAQQAQQGQPGASTGTASGGSGFRPLQAPVIIRKTPKPDAKPEQPAQTGGGGAVKKARGGGSAGSVRLPVDSADWEPIAVSLGGEEGRNSCSWRMKKKEVGPSSAAKTVARFFKTGEDKRLVVAIFPKGLEARRIHFELRLPIVEGILEKAEAAAVFAEAGADPLDDIQALKAKGIPFQEEFPAAAELKLKTLGARNAGTLKAAEFAERLPGGFPGLGVVRCDFDVKETR